MEKRGYSNHHCHRNGHARRRSRDALSTAFIVIFLITYIIFSFSPLIWGFITSFKTFSDLMDHPFGWPNPFRLANYTDAFRNLTVTYNGPGYSVEYNLFTMLWHSLAYALVGSFASTTCTYLVAYASAMYRYKFNRVLDLIVLIGISLPVVGNLPSQIRVAQAFHLYENFFGVALIMKFNFLSIFYFVLQARIKSIPRALSEAAEIDGSSDWQIMTRVISPIVFPAYSTVFAINFVVLWNDYGTPYVFLKSFPTVAYGLWEIKSASAVGLSLPVQLAASMIALLPILVVFFVFRDKIMGGISLNGGIKE